MDLQQIGSSHPLIRQAVALIKNSAPNRNMLFVAEGLWAHNAVLSASVPVRTFFWCPEAIYSSEAKKRSAEVAQRAERAFRISEKTLARISERDKPDGLVSIVQMPAWDADLIELSDDALVVVADAIEIPGNLGTLIRTIDACGAELLILTNRRTRMTHPKVFRGSHGMSLTIPFLDLDQPEGAISWLKHNNFSVYVADTDDAKHYRTVDYSGRTAIVLGNERYGVSNPWYRHNFERVYIPMRGQSDSLNVSISAAVLLYEARAQKDSR
ncbi:TrmH family RNA methyltransferase [Microlunatus speluncae]|uniref:TrmH family RNA methyltransferase n=1 Tax=Microlunatus speluncae TaxID=2594267 RepID=UPI00126687E3|nr:TrmH family RNA methyltransferase [Microlunatus speluncae]